MNCENSNGNKRSRDRELRDPQWKCFCANSWSGYLDGQRKGERISRPLEKCGARMRMGGRGRRRSRTKTFNNTNGSCSVPSAILASIFGWRQQQPVSDSGPIVRSKRNVFLRRIPVISLLLLLLILLFNGDPFGTGPFIPRHSSRFRSDPHDKRISRLWLDNRLYNYVWAAPWKEGSLTRLFSTACLPDEQPKNIRSRPGLNNSRMKRPPRLPSQPTH